MLHSKALRFCNGCTSDNIDVTNACCEREWKTDSTLLLVHVPILTTSGVCFKTFCLVGNESDIFVLFYFLFLYMFPQFLYLL